MDIHWAGLGSVLLVGLIAGVGLVALFGTGVRLLAQEPAVSAVRPLAVTCFAVCAVVAGYGIYLLLQK